MYIYNIHIVAGQWVWGFHATKLNGYNDTTDREQFKAEWFIYRVNKTRLGKGSSTSYMI